MNIAKKKSSLHFTCNNKIGQNSRAIPINSTKPNPQKQLYRSPKPPRISFYVDVLLELNLTSRNNYEQIPLHIVLVLVSCSRNNLFFSSFYNFIVMKHATLCNLLRRDLKAYAFNVFVSHFDVHSIEAIELEATLFASYE